MMLLGIKISKHLLPYLIETRLWEMIGERERKAKKKFVFATAVWTSIQIEMHNSLHSEKSLPWKMKSRIDHDRMIMDNFSKPLW